MLIVSVLLLSLHSSVTASVLTGASPPPPPKALGAPTLDATLNRARINAVSLSPKANFGLALIRKNAHDNPRTQPILSIYDLRDIAGRSEPQRWRFRLKPGRWGYFRWAQDESRVMALRWGRGYTEVWVFPTDGKPPRLMMSPHMTSTFSNVFWNHDNDGEIFAIWYARERGRSATVLSRFRIEDGSRVEDLTTLRGLFVKEAVLSPDRESLAVIGSRQRSHGPAGGRLDLYHVDTVTGESRRLTQAAGIAARPTWSGDSRMIAYAWTPEPSLISIDKREIVVVDVATSRHKILTEAFPLSIGNGIYGVDEPLFFSPSGSHVVTATQHGLADHILSVHVKKGTSRWITAGNYSVKPMTVARDRFLALSVGSSPDQPETVLFHDLSAGTERVIDRPNAALERIPLASAERIPFVGNDGLAMEGVLLYPPKGQAPYPLLVLLHGGSSGRHTLRFGDSYAQIYASLGYAVFQPNTRGSAGYDKNFAQGNVGDFGGDEVDDVLCATDALVARGVADPTRLFVYGHSYGGYLGQMVIAKDRRFRAAASLSGVSDWKDLYETTDLPDLPVMGLGGTPYDNPDAYREASPLHYIDQIDTPLLLIHGEYDGRVPATQSRSMHFALGRLNRPTDLILLYGEGHIPRGQSIEAVINSVHAWFVDHGAGL